MNIHFLSAFGDILDKEKTPLPCDNFLIASVKEFISNNDRSCIHVLGQSVSDLRRDENIETWMKISHLFHCRLFSAHTLEDYNKCSSYAEFTRNCWAPACEYSVTRSKSLDALLYLQVYLGECLKDRPSWLRMRQFMVVARRKGKASMEDLKIVVDSDRVRPYLTKSALLMLKHLIRCRDLYSHDGDSVDYTSFIKEGEPVPCLDVPPVAVVEPPKKKARLSLSWECPVCLEELGDSKGLVPCTITTCQPAPHSICLDCYEELMKQKRTDCPKCRQPIGSIVPMFDMVPRDDDVALAKVKALSNDAKVANMKKNAKEKLEKNQKVHENLLLRRLELVIDAVQSRMYKYRSSPIGSTDVRYYSSAPTWDSLSTSNRGSKLKQKRLEQLNVAAAELQPHLAEVFADSIIDVVMDESQMHKNRLVYMKYTVTRKR